MVLISLLIFIEIIKRYHKRWLGIIHSHNDRSKNIFFYLVNKYVFNFQAMSFDCERIKTQNYLAVLLLSCCIYFIKHLETEKLSQDKGSKDINGVMFHVFYELEKIRLTKTLFATYVERSIRPTALIRITQ